MFVMPLEVNSLVIEKATIPGIDLYGTLHKARRHYTSIIKAHGLHPHILAELVVNRKFNSCLEDLGDKVIRTFLQYSKTPRLALRLAPDNLPIRLYKQLMARGYAIGPRLFSRNLSSQRVQNIVRQVLIRQLSLVTRDTWVIALPYRNYRYDSTGVLCQNGVFTYYCDIGHELPSFLVDSEFLSDIGLALFEERPIPGKTLQIFTKWVGWKPVAVVAKEQQNHKEASRKDRFLEPEIPIRKAVYGTSAIGQEISLEQVEKLVSKMVIRDEPINPTSKIFWDTSTTASITFDEMFKVTTTSNEEDG